MLWKNVDLLRHKLFLYKKCIFNGSSTVKIIHVHIVKTKMQKKLNKGLERPNYLHRLFSSFIMRKLESFFSEFSLSYVSSIFYCFLLAGIVFGWRTFPCQKLHFVSSLKIWVSTSINIYCAAQRLSGGPSHTHTHTRIHTHTYTHAHIHIIIKKFADRQTRCRPTENN